MEKNHSILQKGSIYFFFRPKVERQEIDKEQDVQHAMILLNPEQSQKYILLMLGKKHLPQNAGESYFAFIDKVFFNSKNAIEALQEKSYHTKTKGERTVNKGKCIGYGTYIIFFYHDHSCLAYQLAKSKDVDASSFFKLEDNNTFVLQVKNPKKGLSFVKKTERSEQLFPNELVKLFDDHKFLPINTTKFLEYEGAEILLIARDKEIPAEFSDYLQNLSSKKKNFNNNLID